MKFEFPDVDRYRTLQTLAPVDIALAPKRANKSPPPNARYYSCITLCGCAIHRKCPMCPVAANFHWLADDTVALRERGQKLERQQAVRQNWQVADF